MNVAASVEIVRSYLANLEVGQEVVCRNLTMFPLNAPVIREPGYLTLDEALAAGLVRVSEVSESGSVPELRLENRGSSPVLLLDGEELVGAKQNRVLNLTVLAPANKTILIPVSCVEAGRWNRATPDFAAAPRAQYARGRQKKMEQVTESLLLCDVPRSNQGEVWADISAKASRMASPSPTAAMSAIFETHAARLDDYVGGFTAGGSQVGALFAINGEISGFDLFDAPATLRKLLPKLVRSFALDALDALAAEARPADRKAALALLDAARTSPGETFPGVGCGEDVRLSGPGFAGGGLVYEGRLIHLAGFHTGSASRPAEQAGSTMARASRRRSHQG